MSGLTAATRDGNGTVTIDAERLRPSSPATAAPA